MFNALIEDILTMQVYGAVLSSLGSSFGSNDRSDSLVRENEQLRNTVEQQSRRIDQLESAVVEVGTAVNQIGTALFAPNPALPAAGGDKVASFSVGQIFEGRVNKLCKRGVNVTIANYFGYLPLTEIPDSWGSDVSDVLRVGQEVTVQVVKVDHQKELVTLSMKCCRE